MKTTLIVVLIVLAAVAPPVTFAAGLWIGYQRGFYDSSIEEVPDLTQ